MKVKKMRVQLPIRSFEYSGEGQKSRHGPLLPDHPRMVCCGPSNAGKTDFLLNLLIHKNGIKFKNVYLFCKTLDQPKYRFLERAINQVKGVSFYGFKDGILSPDEVEDHSVVIFDDINSEDPAVIQDYYSRGRHKSLCCLLVCQTYSSVKKQLIRDNCNLIVLFKMDLVNLKHVYSDHVSCDMSFNKLHELCVECWKMPYGTFIINKECEKSNGRYRRGIDEYIKLE